MASVQEVILYTFTFLSIYVQVFFLVTFIEKRKSIVHRKVGFVLKRYPSVTIIVPCYNEEKTIYKTVRSLLALEYPKNKLKIIIVDDGSKDRTWETIQRFAKYPQIEAYRKENGGKHTAMNFALEKVTTELVGGLDADSFVDSQALRRIASYFEDQTVMAVAPSILVHEPKNILQRAQRAEYNLSIYNKKMLAFLNGIHVTPGPFSIFRKKVFDDLGPYRKAHNTEDQEIALRMQEFGYRIEHCPDAYVYTMSPPTIMKLYRQRLRWIYGFIKNAVDYRRLMFKKKHGTVGMFTMPSGFISVFSVLFLFGFLVYNLINFLINKINQIRAVGFTLSFSSFNFEWFYLSTKSIVFISFFLYFFIIMALVLGRKVSGGKARVSFDIVYFILIFSVIAPFWIVKAFINAIVSKESSWTQERKITNN